MTLVPQAYKFNAPVGVVGDVTRPDNSSVEPVKFSETYVPTVFGFPVYYVAGEPRKWTTGLAATDFQGILVREVPSIAGSVDSDASAAGGVPWFEQVMGLLVRGYAVVKCASGTPTRGGAVYVQITASGGVAVGEFRADSDGGNSVVLTATQATWESNGLGTDTEGNVNLAEIRIAR
jgi:hypothetical protein